MGSRDIESEQFLQQGASPLPVLLVEGAFAPEFSLAPLQNELQQAGYPALLLDQSFPLNLVAGVEKVVDERVDEINQAFQAPVVIIGHSLGGTYAARKEQRDPERVAGIITVASPIHNPGDIWTSPWLVGDFASDITIPEGKPAISIYSPFDMVVPSFLSVNTTFSEHREIWSLPPLLAHQAIIFHPKTHRIIKEKLYEINHAVGSMRGNQAQPAAARVV